MSKYHLKILAPAQRELEEIADIFFEWAGAASARKITDRILNSLERLKDFPLMGVLHKDKDLQREGYRILICGEYICVYRLIDDTIFVYHIVHGSTNYPQLFKDNRGQQADIENEEE